MGSTEMLQISHIGGEPHVNKIVQKKNPPQLCLMCTNSMNRLLYT